MLSKKNCLHRKGPLKDKPGSFTRQWLENEVSTRHLSGSPNQTCAWTSRPAGPHYIQYQFWAVPIHLKAMASPQPWESHGGPSGWKKNLNCGCKSEQLGIAHSAWEWGLGSSTNAESWPQLLLPIHWPQPHLPPPILKISLPPPPSPFTSPDFYSDLESPEQICPTIDGSSTGRPVQVLWAVALAINSTFMMTLGQPKGPMLAPCHFGLFP